MPTPRPTPRPTPGSAPESATGSADLAALDRAIVALESQRAILGDEVVQTALAPLRAQRERLVAVELGEQRRLVTVLFADLVDFTVLSRQLDPEDTRGVVDRCFQQWNAAVETEGGLVEKFIGDAAMAVFGLRESFDDDAERAVRAGLAMTAALPALSADVERDFGVALHMRVGVDTGEVVVSTLGERPRSEFVAVGPTVNRASRLQSAAPVDGVLVSTDTYRLIRSGFSVDPRPGLVLKGIDEPVDAYVVVSERPRGFRLDRVGAVGGVEADTVGRSEELAFLQDQLAAVDERRWRLVSLVGDAGIGKSRLLRDFDLWLAGRPEPVWWFRGRASPSERNRPNALTRDVVGTRMGVQETDSPETVRHKLESGFATALGDGPEATRAAHVVGVWLGFDLGDGLVGVPADPQAVRDQGTRALGRYFTELAETAPVVLLLEDLQWADSASVRLLEEAGGMFEGSRLLVVATMRPAFVETRPRWGEQRDHRVALTLGALSRTESRALVLDLLRRVVDLPETLVDLVVDRAEGNPFYLEELVTWLVDNGVVVPGQGRWRVVPELIGSAVVPPTLKGVLQARLDSLTSPERALVQRASVVGRVFWDEAVSSLDPVPLGLQTFDRLRERELVFERELSAFESTREFLFRHALLRDVAYDSVLRTRRQEYHRRAADWLAQVSGTSGRSEEYAALVADHLDRAADPGAADWYLRAARRAARVFALDEATQLLDRAERRAPPERTELLFDIVAAREDVFERTGDRERQDADLATLERLREGLDPRRTVTALLARARRSFDASTYDEAISLAREAASVSEAAGLDDLVPQAHLAMGKALTWDSQGEPARRAVRTARELAAAGGNRALEAESLRYLGMIANNEGAFTEALDRLDEARTLFAAEDDLEMESTALAQLGSTYFNMGRIDDARRAFEEVLDVFRTSGHKYRQAIVLGNLASIALTQGALTLGLERGLESLQMSIELEDVESASTNLVIVGLAELWTGRWVQSRAHLEAARDRALEIPSAQLEAGAAIWLAVGTLENGDPEEAETLARSALALADQDEVSPLQQGQAALVLAHALLAQGEVTGGRAAASDARAAFQRSELPSAQLECDAVEASATAMQGDVEAAARLARDVVDRLDGPTLDALLRPPTVLRTCWETLDEADSVGREQVLVNARHYLQPRLADPASAGFRRVPSVADLLALVGDPDGINSAESTNSLAR